MPPPPPLLCLGFQAGVAPGEAAELNSGLRRDRSKKYSAWLSPGALVACGHGPGASRATLTHSSGRL